MSAPLREAAAGRAVPGVEVVRGSPPGLLGADAIHALTSLMMAALVIAATVLRTGLAHPSFDLILLLLRTASVAFVLRAAIAIALWARRVATDARAHEHVLAWSDEGLLYVRPHAREQFIARTDVLALVVPEQLAQRGARSLRPLYVVGRPPHSVCLPPYFAVDSELLAARLRRWCGALPERAADFAPPAEGPEDRYTRAARGKLHDGEVPVPEGVGYRLRAPYGVLLALLFVIDAVRVAGPRLYPAAFASALLGPCALLGWFMWMRRRRATRLGMAMLLTPEELLVRGPHGAVSLPWPQLASVEVVARQAWSPFVGRFLVRSLWFHARDGTTMLFDAAFLGWPPEIIAAQAEGYRTGRLASQGSGAGGGISGSSGATTSAHSAS
ncbi:MAG TPA: hypothetical protein VI299_03910 [Polyangiales bacterium]